VAYDAVHDRSPHKQCEVVPKDVTPLESEEFAAAESSGEIEDNHRANGFVELLKQMIALSDGEHLRLAYSFTCAADAHQFHRVLTDLDEFPTHGAVPQHAHEVVKMSSGPRSDVQVPQPLLDREGFHLVDRIVPPPRFDVMVEVRPVRLGGRV